MTMTVPRILVILLNYRTAPMTLRAAEAALGAMPDAGAELVIVDNASGDGSADVIAQAIIENGWDKAARVRLIASEVNGGFGAGNNIGFGAGMFAWGEAELHRAEEGRGGKESRSWRETNQ